MGPPNPTDLAPPATDPPRGGGRAGEIERLLRRNGFSLTPQRRAIVRHLSEHGGHWAPSQLLASLTEAFPKASRATVYATLALLRDLGAVSEVPGAGGEVLFDANPAPHQHFRCTGCGRLDDVPEDWFPVSTAPGRSLPFEVDRFQIIAVGRCTACR